TSAGTELFRLVRAAANNATVRRADATASSRIRRFATLGWLRPARQSRVEATAESTVQWIRKAIRERTIPVERGSPGPGNRGIAKVHTIIATVIRPSARSSR